MLTWVSPTWRDLKRLQCIQSLKSIEFSVQIFFALFRLQFFANWSCWNNLKRRKYSLRVWIMLTIFTWYSTTKKYVFITSKSNNLCFEFVWLKCILKNFIERRHEVNADGMKYRDSIFTLLNTFECIFLHFVQSAFANQLNHWMSAIEPCFFTTKKLIYFINRFDYFTNKLHVPANEKDTENSYYTKSTDKINGEKKLSIDEHR